MQTFVSPSSGDRVNRCWQLPGSYAELVQRREALTAWAELTYGFMGRSPDHVASCLSGMVIGTSTIMANEVLVTSIQPLKPGEEKYAFTAAVPLGTKGLKNLSRKSYEAAAVSEFDNPLATLFDENDAVLYFDEVKIPWERVFTYRDTDMCRAQFHDAPTHVYQNYQAQIRLMIKTRFLLGLARKIAEVNGILNFPRVVETLGLLAAQVAMVEGLVQGMEAAGTQYGKYFVPN